MSRNTAVSSVTVSPSPRNHVVAGSVKNDAHRNHCGNATETCMYMLQQPSVRRYWHLLNSNCRCGMWLCGILPLTTFLRLMHCPILGLLKRLDIWTILLLFLIYCATPTMISFAIYFHQSILCTVYCHYVEVRLVIDWSWHCFTQKKIRRCSIIRSVLIVL